jgi:hypothetical protein
MVLVQLAITYDDLINQQPRVGQNKTVSPITIGAASFINTGTVLVPINMNSGSYIAKVVGCEIASGLVNTTSFAFQPQIIIVSSPNFQFPGNGNQGLYFSNNGQFCQSDVKGCREFRINFAQGQFPISLNIAQLGDFSVAPPQATAPWSLSPLNTWTQAQFAYMILTLDLEVCDDQFPILLRK